MLVGMTDPLLPPGEAIDLTNCDREPIHVPDAIQPHGYLFVLRSGGLDVLQASENVPELLGRPLEDVIGHDLGELLAPEQGARLQAWMHEWDEGAGSMPRLPVTSDGRTRVFHAVAHPNEAGVLLEFEPFVEMEGDAVVDPFVPLQAAITRLQQARSTEVLCRIAAQEVRRITRMDRVMIYRFDADWHGEVIAEDRAEHVASYLGLHFPASDIPKQARHLYTLNRLCHRSRRANR